MNSEGTVLGMLRTHEFHAHLIGAVRVREVHANSVMNNDKTVVETIRTREFHVDSTCEQ